MNSTIDADHSSVSQLNSQAIEDTLSFKNLDSQQEQHCHLLTSNFAASPLMQPHQVDPIYNTQHQRSSGCLPEASIINDTFCNLIVNRISPIMNYSIAVDYNHMR